MYNMRVDSELWCSQVCFKLWCLLLFLHSRFSFTKVLENVKMFSCFSQNIEAEIDTDSVYLKLFSKNLRGVVIWYGDNVTKFGRVYLFILFILKCNMYISRLWIESVVSLNISSRVHLIFLRIMHSVSVHFRYYI